LARLGGLGAGAGAGAGQAQWISVDFATIAEALGGKGSQGGLQ
jgi:hypothetical protein